MSYVGTESLTPVSGAPPVQSVGTAPLATRQSDRVRQAVRAERKGGLLLAFRLRAGVLVLVMAYLLGFGWSWDQAINIADLTALCLVGWAQYRVAGTAFDRPLVMALFPVADVLLIAIAVFVGPEWEGIPRIVFDEDRSFAWFVLLLALQALAYRPWLALWSGVVTAAVWVGVLVWLLQYPGAHGWTDVPVPPGADHVETMLSAYYNPSFIHVEGWIREALIAIICGAILGVAVFRSQGMLSRAVQAERSRANLARYFSPSMVDRLAGKDQPFDGAREQPIGVVFADIVGFTRLAEQSAPDELIRLLREFHGRVARLVFEHSGTVDKFIGDCAMATFGTPEPGSDDATRTIACCRAIASAVDEWNAKRRDDGLAPVQVGIGAHYGRVVIGDIGDERRLEFAVLGDTVNVASRLEHLTRVLNCTILLSDDLVEAARREGAEAALLEGFTAAEPQYLRNRNEPVRVWSFG